MDEGITLFRAKQIMGDDIIGPDELRTIPWLDKNLIQDTPVIPFSEKTLTQKKEDYYLILGVGRLADGRDLTIRNLTLLFGKDPEKVEPCFYNQDWYEKELFVDEPMKNGWYFVRKNVYEESRAVLPGELMKSFTFPSAITCTYSFFVAWISGKGKLWFEDFIWCSDTDHNGDRIYVGKYHDKDGMNKNGFSIHRHLALRPCYGCIDQ